MPITFQKAVKYEAKGRVALVGPAGSGKSYTMLTLARLLAGSEGKIAAVDTEQGSLSKYADLFDFDVIPLKSFSADLFLESLHAAEEAGYAVFCCDSLSHFWMGKDGALEFVDTAAKRSSSRDGMSGWKEFRPYEREMVDAMLSSPCHVICTMRTKTAYEDQVNDKGKKVRVKIGLAPVQREGLEYEFDLVGLMNDDNTFIVDKTRCPALNGKSITKPNEKTLLPFKTWLTGAALPAPPPASEPVAPPTPSLPRMNGNILTAQVLNVEQRESRNKKPLIAVKIKGFIDGKDLFTSWHVSFWPAISTGKGKVCQFEMEENAGYLNIVDVLAIGDQEYRDGKPYTENPDSEPTTNATANPEITNADLPESLFA
jgi:energy-coupling factor transporter ATP-binding protein EcfA2